MFELSCVILQRQCLGVWISWGMWRMYKNILELELEYFSYVIKTEVIIY